MNFRKLLYLGMTLLMTSFFASSNVLCQQHSVREFGLEWKMHCTEKESALSGCVVSRSFDGGNKQGVNLWATVEVRFDNTRSQSLLKIILPPEAHYGTNVTIVHKNNEYGHVRLACSQESCVGLWELGPEFIQRFITDGDIVVQYKFTEAAGIRLLLDSIGLEEAITHLSKKRQ